jgi:hypothetical protein
MRCMTCGVKMILMNVIPDDTLTVLGLSATHSSALNAVILTDVWCTLNAIETVSPVQCRCMERRPLHHLQPSTMCLLSLLGYLGGRLRSCAVDRLTLSGNEDGASMSLLRVAPILKRKASLPTSDFRNLLAVIV